MAKLIVYFDGARPGAWNMTRDQELLAAHRPGAETVLRLYRWRPAAVTIGYNQDFSDFARGAIADRGYDLVRRPTGGRAILHADELTYAVIGTSPSALFGETLHSTYLKINTALLAFLGRLGVDASLSDGESRDETRGLVCFHSAGRYEVKVGGRKLVGSAQRRTGGVFLQHGSILAGPRHLELSALLGDPGGGRDTAAAELATATTDLAQLLGARQGPSAIEAHAQTLATCFGESLGLELVVAGQAPGPTADAR